MSKPIMVKRTDVREYPLVLGSLTDCGEKLATPEDLEGAGFLPAPQAGPRRKVITLCGSTKFKRAFNEWNARLTAAGSVVLSVAMWGHADRLDPAPELKAELDRVHKAKIDLSDEILVIDVGGYIGESTRSEIDHAIATGKHVRFLSKEHPTWTEADCTYWRDAVPAEGNATEPIGYVTRLPRRDEQPPVVWRDKGDGREIPLFASPPFPARCEAENCDAAILAANQLLDAEKKRVDKAESRVQELESEVAQLQIDLGAAVRDKNAASREWDLSLTQIHKALNDPAIGLDADSIISAIVELRGDLRQEVRERDAHSAHVDKLQAKLCRAETAQRNAESAVTSAEAKLRKMLDDNVANVRPLEDLIDYVEADLNAEHDRANKAESAVEQGKKERDEARKWLEEVHRAIGRGSHIAPDANARCIIDAIYDARGDLAEETQRADANARRAEEAESKNTSLDAFVAAFKTWQTDHFNIMRASYATTLAALDALAPQKGTKEHDCVACRDNPLHCDQNCPPTSSDAGLLDPEDGTPVEWKPGVGFVPRTPAQRGEPKPCPHCGVVGCTYTDHGGALRSEHIEGHADAQPSPSQPAPVKDGWCDCPDVELRDQVCINCGKRIPDDPPGVISPEEARALKAVRAWLADWRNADAAPAGIPAHELYRAAIALSNAEGKGGMRTVQGWIASCIPYANNAVPLLVHHDNPKGDRVPVTVCWREPTSPAKDREE